MCAAAQAARPREYCAALLGARRGDGEMVVTDCVSLRNADGRPGHFAVADAELRHAERAAAARGLGVVAWLHSHPGGSTSLSPMDRESLAVARLPWVIAACRDDGSATFAAYSGGTAEPITLVLRP
jgi:proteasome lid subunit RPN8/RPN11